MANGSKASSGPLNAFFTAVFVALDERHMRGYHKDEWAGMAYTLCYSIHASSRVSVNGVWRLSS
jgi:hypothetical protein